MWTGSLCMSDPASLSGGSGGQEAVLGIVTISDRASAGTYEDLSGPAILQFFHQAIKSRHARTLISSHSQTSGS